MAKYDYVELSYDGNYNWLVITSTDPAAVQWAAAEIKKLEPRAQQKFDNMPDDQPYYCRVEKPKHDLSFLVWWLMRQLCHMSWEPLQEDDTNHFHSLKRRSE